MTRRFVILTGVSFALAQLSLAQFSSARPSTQKRDTGPRALALLEISPNGTAHLVPIAIMIGDDFFDASAYKADPVPMALDSGTVYEAVKTGVSQGLFTIKEAAQTGIYWSGRGKWQTSAEIAAAAAAKKARAKEKPPTLADDDSGPPKLLRRSPETKSSPPAAEPTKPSAPSSASTPPQNPAPPASKSAPASPSESPQPAPAPSAPSTSASAKPTAPSASTAPTPPTPDPSEVSGENDPNRPRLDRGKPSASRKTQSRASDTAPNSMTTASVKPGSPASSANHSSSASNSAPNAASKEPSVQDASVQEIPAISDASGPEPRSYVFPLKPGEADQFRKKLLAQASQLVRAKVKQESSEEPAHRTTRASAKSKSTARAPEPTFQNVKLRVFDLSSSNQASMVLQATAHVAGLPEPQQITIVARQDLYGELHDSLANITDEKHHDIVPQMDLIDVVDADGDGRGELLFRETSDEGRAYSIYRVIGDQLYQLYKSTPQ